MSRYRTLGRRPVHPRLAHLLPAAPQVVFVCSGNAVRSAFAHLYAEHRGLPREVCSLATRYRNATLFPETAAALRARGVAEDAIRGFRSRHVEPHLAAVAPDAVVLGMRAHHLEPLMRLRERAFLLPAVLGSSDEIPDPVEEGADFAETFAHVARCVDALVLHLAAARR
jgi:protein-tyrosine-phosphatase